LPPKVRTVPRSSARSGITLKAWPALICVTDTTPSSNGLRRRDTRLCSAVTRCDAISTGSIACCGAAAWPPRPTIVISNWSTEATRSLRPVPQPDHARPAHLGPDAVAQGLEPLRHERAGAPLLEAELGVLVEVTARRDQLGAVDRRQGHDTLHVTRYTLHVTRWAHMQPATWNV